MGRGTLAACVPASIKVTSLVRFSGCLVPCRTRKYRQGAGSSRPSRGPVRMETVNSMLAKYETYKVRQWNRRIPLDALASLATCGAWFC